MKRKVIKQGNGTLTITLPKQWTKNVGLKGGDEIDVGQKEGFLIINSPEFSDKLKYQVEIGKLERLGRRYITALYREGYDEIQLRYDNPVYVNSVQATLNEQVIGFEITNRFKNSCLLKDFSGGGEKEFEKSLRRSWLLVMELSDETINSIKDKDFEALKEMHMKDREINKFTNYTIRLLLKLNRFGSKKTALYFHFLRSLEEVGDEYQNLSVYIADYRPKVNDEELKIIEKNNEHLRNFYELFYKYDDHSMEQLFIDTKKTFKKIEKLSSEKKHNPMVMHYLFSISEGIRKLLSTVVEIEVC